MSPKASKESSEIKQPRPDFVQRTPVDILVDKQQRIAHFRDRVADIPIVDMPAVQQLVRDARIWEEAVQFHKEIIEQDLRKILDLLHPGAGRRPKEVQIDAVHALIFGQSDVLVIARTAEGKSLVFQAFAMLTGQVTLQIVPLNRLGIEQSDDIERMNRVQVEAGGEAGEPIVCSVAVTAEEKDRNPDNIPVRNRSLMYNTTEGIMCVTTDYYKSLNVTRREKFNSLRLYEPSEFADFQGEFFQLAQEQGLPADQWIEEFHEKLPPTLRAAMAPHLRTSDYDAYVDLARDISREHAAVHRIERKRSGKLTTPATTPRRGRSAAPVGVATAPQATRPARKPDDGVTCFQVPLAKFEQADHCLCDSGPSLYIKRSQRGSTSTSSWGLSKHLTLAFVS